MSRSIAFAAGLVLILPALAAALPSAPSAADAILACARVARCVTETTDAVARDTLSVWSAVPTGAVGPAAATRLALAAYGAPAPETSPAPHAVPDAGSPSLAAAILAVYDAHAVPVDPALARDVHAQAAAVDPAFAASLVPLLDGVADGARAARGILPPEDVALLAADPRAAMMLATFGAGPDAPAAWRDAWAPRAAALARIDRTAVAAAALPVVDAVAAFAPPAAVPADPTAPSACPGTLDLPFVRVAGDCADEHIGTFFVLVDTGGDDTYSGAIAGGLPGAAVAIDLGAGADRYTATTMALGFGIAGVGVLYDDGGPDRYEIVSFGQGASAAGVGVLYDAGVADDVYESPGVNGTIATKAATLGGVGVLVDEGGNDAYHQDGLDGFVYAASGGVGVMLERGGDDTYVSNDIDIWLVADAGLPLIPVVAEYLGKFTGPVQISAEVGATAILVEEDGDDVYVCGAHVRQGCQGAGGAGALGMLLEARGEDEYRMGASFSEELVPGLVIFPMGQGAGYGPSAPGGVGVLADLYGSDAYTAEKWAQGFGTVGAGVLLDRGAGLDAYSIETALVGARGDGQVWADGAAGAGADT
ncbi:MAG TPA: hypothetical protein VI997_11855 [Candidatus Thermoplasmatota archaeon]|nr:hypothetical protein [Candidatus Thermoplasmatota archaeon]